MGARRAMRRRRGPVRQMTTRTYLSDKELRAMAEIRVEDMSQGYWVKRYNGARRVVEK